MYDWKPVVSQHINNSPALHTHEKQTHQHACFMIKTSPFDVYIVNRILISKDQNKSEQTRLCCLLQISHNEIEHWQWVNLNQKKVKHFHNMLTHAQNLEKEILPRSMITPTLSACLPPMWPRVQFPDPLSYCVWFEFDRSLLFSESFFPWFSSFSLSSKTNIWSLLLWFFFSFVPTFPSWRALVKLHELEN